jgi:hypothetical protein
VALFVGPGTEGYFANLKITQSRALVLFRVRARARRIGNSRANRKESTLTKTAQLEWRLLGFHPHDPVKEAAVKKLV